MVKIGGEIRLHKPRSARPSILWGKWHFLEAKFAFSAFGICLSSFFFYSTLHRQTHQHANLLLPRQAFNQRWQESLHGFDG